MDTHLDSSALRAGSRGGMISKLIAKALHEYPMIDDGDSVLLAASGGKDSTTLLIDLAEKNRHGEIRCRLEAVHIATEFSPPASLEMLESLCGGLGVPLRTVRISVGERLKPGRSMNCYWCSTQRRTELIRFAMANGFAKIALGHHLDDILETLFMNMLRKAEFSTMPPFVRYDKYPVAVIRPLALVEENRIVSFIEELGLGRHVCTCAYGANSWRDEVRERLEAFTGGSGAAKLNLFRSMRNIREDYLA